MKNLKIKIQLGTKIRIWTTGFDREKEDTIENEIYIRAFLICEICILENIFKANKEENIVERTTENVRKISN